MALNNVYAQLTWEPLLPDSRHCSSASPTRVRCLSWRNGITTIPQACSSPGTPSMPGTARLDNQ